VKGERKDLLGQKPKLYQYKRGEQRSPGQGPGFTLDRGVLEKPSVEKAATALKKVRGLTASLAEMSEVEVLPSEEKKVPNKREKKPFDL